MRMMALSNTSTDKPALRKRVHKDWTPFWRRGAKQEENLFGLPRDMIASGNGVIVADGGGLEVFAFDTAGKTKWKMGGKGGGPGEFRELTNVTLDSNGNAVILDARNGRVTFVDRTGKLVRTVSTGSIGWPSDICLFANGNMLFTVAASDHFFMLTDAEWKAATGTSVSVADEIRFTTIPEAWSSGERNRRERVLVLDSIRVWQCKRSGKRQRILSLRTSKPLRRRKFEVYPRLRQTKGENFSRVATTLRSRRSPTATLCCSLPGQTSIRPTAA